MSLARVAFRPLLRSTRSAGHSSHHLPNHGATLPDMTKWKPQTPDGPFYDGWAGAVSYFESLVLSDVPFDFQRMPFRARRPRLFVIGATAIFSCAFGLPFFMVEYQLRKTNQ